LDVQHAILCDYGATTADGKLVAAGIFSVLAVPSLPGVHPHMALVMRIHVHPGEAPDHSFKVTLVDPDGRALFNVDGRFGVEKVHPGEGAFAQVVLNMNNLRFQRHGPYSFDIFIDGRLEHQVPVAVRAVPGDAEAHGEGEGPGEAEGPSE
jgi:hypothetical protein